jgi:hypothetical protein
VNDESTSVQALAERLAAGGREALLARLRDAFAQAAAKHADLVSVDGVRLEELVRRSAERADGLLWRHALAEVASAELGIGLVDALSHPAVTRAQQLLGAPSYEASLAELARRTEAPGADGSAAAEEEEPEQLEDEARLRVSAIHVGGVQDLPAATELQLLVSPDGLDIVRDETEIIGRLGWAEIQELEVPAVRSRQRRRSRGARLIVRTRDGDATFEVPAFSAQELRERTEPLIARYGNRRHLTG